MFVDCTQYASCPPPCRITDCLISLLVAPTVASTGLLVPVVVVVRSLKLVVGLLSVAAVSVIPFALVVRIAALVVYSLLAALVVALAKALLWPTVEQAVKFLMCAP